MTDKRRNSLEIKCKESYNWLIHLHYVRGEYDICYQRIEKINITSEYSYYLRGLIALREKGDVNSALNYFNQIPSKNNVTFIKALVRCFMLLGKHNKICDIVQENGLRLSPNDWQLWYMLGNSYLHLGNITSAKDAFQHALQTSNQIEPFLALSQCHSIENDHKSAIFVLRRAADISTDNINLVVKLGLLLMNSENKIKGIEKISQLTQISAITYGNLPVSLAVGSILQEIKQDFEGALYRYKLSECFESPSLWNNIAICFSKKKKYVAAVSCLKRALYLNPFDHRINYNLGLLSLQLRQYASAFHYFKASAAMHKSSPIVFSLLAICLENLEDNMNAKQAHLTATKGSEFNPIALINYAIFLSNDDSIGNREVITELLMEFEQNWLKNKSLDNNLNEILLRSVQQITSSLNLSIHLTKRDLKNESEERTNE